MTKYTEKQLQAWADFEEVRLGGLFNMDDSDAGKAAGLTKEEHFFVINHYNTLQEAYIEAEDIRILAQAESHGH